MHQFVVEGMADNARACQAAGVTYLPYVEPQHGAGGGLLESLASRACLVVTDRFPCFFLPRMVAAAAATLPARLEQIDGNGLFPLEAADRDFTVAHSFRRYLQKNLRPHLAEVPVPEPLDGLAALGRATVPKEVLRRWNPGIPEVLPVRTRPDPVTYRGGPEQGARTLARFLRERLDRYAADRNHPDEDVASGLSPYLHFGHVGTHQVVADLFAREDWVADDLAAKATGKRHGWWGLSEPTEAFLDELVTWRELGHVFGHRRPGDVDRYDSLPDWARQTLDAHRADPRPYLYDLDDLDAAATHDPVWNAAQRQLVEEGRIHNYLRMLWGKKILHWSPSPQEAFAAMVELNNRYAVDGRDPNSYSGIAWVLGRFDRAWGPERPVFGKVRYMSSRAASRKLRMKRYLERWSSP
jgi:deoxyribodipyrimidine photo-lyase